MSNDADSRSLPALDDDATVIEVQDEDLIRRTTDQEDTTQVSDVSLLSRRPNEMEPIPLEAAPTEQDAKEEPESTEAWLAKLAPAARTVLEEARRRAPGWPLARRVPGAVAIPVSNPDPKR